MSCTGCHFLISNRWNHYFKLLKNNYSKEEALTCSGMNRDCCRRIILSSVNVSRKMNHFRMELYTRNEIFNRKRKQQPATGNSTTNPIASLSTQAQFEMDKAMQEQRKRDELNQVSNVIIGVLKKGTKVPF